MRPIYVLEELKKMLMIQRGQNQNNVSCLDDEREGEQELTHSFYDGNYYLVIMAFQASRTHRILHRLQLYHRSGGQVGWLVWAGLGRPMKSGPLDFNPTTQIWQHMVHCQKGVAHHSAAHIK